ncbi:unnamed protein product [Trichobilharzia regenti]|nr:unnamed protein product [Trichobilharzia regenti]
MDWLLRYRRLTSNQQNLFIGGTTCTNGGYTTLNDFDFPSLSSSSSSSNHGATASSSSFESSLLQSESSLANTNRVYYSTSPPFHLSNSFDIDRSVVHNHSNTTANGSNSSMQSSGTQIAAMFAKVRELLAKRDSNGPRLLSLITEELLNCSKLPESSSPLLLLPTCSLSLAYLAVCGKSDISSEKSRSSKFLCESILCLFPHSPLPVALSNLLQSRRSLAIVDSLVLLPSSLLRRIS